MPSTDLTGRVVLVTGAGRGLGRAMALRLASDGAHVAAVARSAGELAESVRLVAEAGGVARAFVADVTDPAAVERMTHDVEDALGAIDVLVNNAGHGGTPGPVWALDADEWWMTQTVNVRGPFLCMAAALRRMVPRGRGRIINVSSRAGNIGLPFASAYVTSKTALTRLTEIAAAEARPHGVFVFAIEPGTVRTAMTERLIDSDAGRTWLPWYRETFDTGRDAQPEEGAHLVARLAAGHADALAGCFISRADDLDALIATAATIARDTQLVLRLVPRS
jgi:NAD(P)-dependent dehydrogenase (short-subunit alcohol dehydrogenase family)